LSCENSEIVSGEWCLVIAIGSDHHRESSIVSREL